MPTITSTRTQTGNNKVIVFNWLAMATSDDGEPVAFAQYTDKSVQITGTFGGATVVIEGSNDGTTYAVLTDPQGNDLNITSAKVEMVSEATRYVRPRVSGGSGTSINVYLLVKE
jgi:hypothetical protein